MIQFNAKTDKGIQRITSPASWRELTLGQLIKLENEWDGADPIQLFSIITGLDVDLLENSTQEGLENTMMAVCSFAYNRPQWEELPAPSHIQIGDKVYKTPKDISKKLLGQKIRVSQIILKSGNDLISSIPKIIAIYMQEVIDGKYDGTRIDEVEKLVMSCSAIDAYGLGQFFFQRSSNLINIGELSSEKSRPVIIPMKKLWNGLQRLKDSAGILT